MKPFHIATTRHTCKAFDASRRIAPQDIAELRTVLRFSASSVNSQPWHFIIAESEAGRARIAETLEGGFAYNAGKVKNASHVIIFCARQDIGDSHLKTLLDQEQSDGRFATPEARENQHKSRAFYVQLHSEQLNDLPHWIDRQIYIALGNLLQASAALGIDACPMEGIDTKALDTAFGLPEQGLRSVVMVALGYRSKDDFNAALPKSRLPEAHVFTVV
jgi:nitroreductase/dihydropteridine reductase